MTHRVLIALEFFPMLHGILWNLRVETSGNSHSLMWHGCYHYSSKKGSVCRSHLLYFLQHLRTRARNAPVARMRTCGKASSCTLGACGASSSGWGSWWGPMDRDPWCSCTTSRMDQRGWTRGSAVGLDTRRDSLATGRDVGGEQRVKPMETRIIAVWRLEPSGLAPISLEFCCLVGRVSRTIA